MQSGLRYGSATASTYFVSVATELDERSVMRMTPSLSEAVEAALGIADALGRGGASGAISVDVSLADELVLSVAVTDGGLLGR